MTEHAQTLTAITYEPLPIGELAPDFALTQHTPIPESASVPVRITRHQFRGKAGLLLIFSADADPVVIDRLRSIAVEIDHIKKLNVRPFVITASAEIADALADLPFPTLIDSDGSAWRAYSDHAQDCRYGMFLLDRYGGVDSELITDRADTLPDGATALDWARFAMYKCIC